ncbi:hypothetical protein G7Z17_g9296 [Cylindrodendrum hubeiense]|uniref:Myb-like domain-containing protein n=1 Tax=Cylindrodendrum hubeiense TaxID=595255 RepID=A0A9P5H1V7_9HYPO|nr:hypothetical protein G7Z17_g9296 [Cylindrodendrum hubeiense]
MSHNATAGNEDSSWDVWPNTSEAEESEQQQSSADESKEVESGSEDKSGHDDSSQSASNDNFPGDSDASSLGVCKKGNGHEKCLKDRCLKSKDHVHNHPSFSEPDSNQSSGDNWQTESSVDIQSETPMYKGKKFKKKAKKAKSTSSTGIASTTEASSNRASSNDNTSSLPESSTDNASTGSNFPAEDSSKASASNSNAVNSKQSTIPDDSGWSISEDFLLRGMKDGSQPATWADIGNALNRSKNEVKARWKVIKDQHQQPSTDDTVEPEPTSGSGRAGGEVSPAENDSNDDEDDTREKDKAVASSLTSRKEFEGKGNGARTSNTAKWHRGTRNDKNAAENRQAKAKATKTRWETCQSLSGEEASSESSTPESSSESSSLSQLGYGNSAKGDEMRYLQDHIYADLYPAAIHPEPDAYLGKRDCELLAAIDSKQKRSRWLEMQANFFNVTGRMVPLDAIRARCERAEEAERAKTRPTEGNLADRLEKVEQWVNRVSQEDVDDPES